MRDFYDVYMLSQLYGDQITPSVMAAAFQATCKKRNSPHLLKNSTAILESLREDSILPERWKSYQKKFSYAANITFLDTLISVAALIRKIL